MTQAATLRNENLPSLTVMLASPRGFCAGVERAIKTVEKALARFGAPVYVRHEIVHNRHVVERLATMGAIFIEDLSEADPSRPIVFSAHGAPRAAHDDAEARNLLKIDATCPLVLKVHNQTRRNAAQGKHIYIVGHANHPEVIGTIGQAPDGATTLVETVDDVAKLPPKIGPKAYVTQTTLSVEDARAIINALQNRFPEISGPKKEDICYATTNRQTAVKHIAPNVEIFVVIGSQTSSNSKRLVDVALSAGASDAMLIDDAQSFDFDKIKNFRTMGLSAGASAPESLVENFLTALAQRYRLVIETIETAREDIAFKLPMRLAG
ncbi:MAG: 4-hydroxy-3-methylbut-2-enyl diphosphate reductase [Marinicaulis sp.]|nr:4-hydroxy-3-methylbut-2-enyl diphosphate reductase [Marinicaulis sp.]NNE40874.1 4-hydroxy-3-methylbut-2-enyl diphosphate reductase [Marinicaulis sp.]NNL90579.1 4-hydroxy-3-methylbut-2-enyl diphosphate reductase [Marinicaulis sp.]